MKPLNCPHCEGKLMPAIFRAYDLEPLVGLPIVMPRLEGLQCSVTKEHKSLDGQVLESIRFALAHAAIELEARLHADLARYLRRYMGLTQQELADRMGITRVTVARWEGGEEPISPQNDYVLRGIARTTLAEKLTKPWARKMPAAFRRLPEVFAEVRQAPPDEPGPTLKAVAKSMTG